MSRTLVVQARGGDSGFRALMNLLLLPGMLIFWVCVAVLWLTKRAMTLFALVGVFVWTRFVIGKHRHAAAPAWLFAAAAVTVMDRRFAWAWLALAVALEFIPDARWDKLTRKVVSARERRLLAISTACIGATLTWPAPWWATLVALAAGCAGTAVPWCRGRRARPVVEPPVLARWRNEVVPALPELKGEWVEFDDVNGTGVLDLANAKASEVAGMDEDVEWILDQVRGTVTLAADPRLSVRRLRVAFTEPGDGGRMRWFDGYTLQKDGSLDAGYGKGNQPVPIRLFDPINGALFISLIAPPGSGKGGLFRIIALEASASPQIEWVGICGKSGGGIGYLAPGSLVMATDKAHWMPVLRAYVGEGRRRLIEAGASGEDSFEARPGRPWFLLGVDELPALYDHGGNEAVRLVEEITGRFRSVGMGLFTTKQKAMGDKSGYGSTLIRSNVMDNGWIGMGPATDNQAKGAGLQGLDFDPSTLPDEPGWFGVCGRRLGAPPSAVRVRWVPNRQDVRKAIDQLGLSYEEACPFGTVEEWLARDTVHPELHPETAALFAGVFTEASGEDEGPGLSLVPSQPADTTPAPADGWTRIREVLEEAGDEGLLRGQIASRAALSPKHTSDLLAARLKKSEVVQAEDKTWRLAS